MDLFVIHGIVEEMKKEIIGGFITKIYQMNRTDLLFRLRRQGEEKQLVISTHPDFQRLHLTEKKYINPMIPPRFCTYLRKHITGARIADISQDPCERIVRIGLQKMMDAGIIGNLVLIVEVVSKASNVLLLDGEKILDCLHFRRAEDGAARPAAPGLVYSRLPSTDRWSPNEVTVERMEEIFHLPAGERWPALVQKISGVSPLIAREIEFGNDGTASGTWQNFRRLFERYEKGNFEPRIATLLSDKKVLCPFILKSLGPAAEELFSSMNQAADNYYFEVVWQRKMVEQKQAMGKRLRQLLHRLQKRRENLLLDQEKFEKDLALKSYGEILTSNYPKLKKGMREVEALDFRQDPPRSVLIPLEEALDPAANVQRYFKRYKKAKRGIEFSLERISETEQEIAYLDSLLFQVEEAGDDEALGAIREELEEAKILSISKKQKMTREKKETSLPVRRFRSTEGLEIYCGKHNVGNEYLLRKMARGNDLWFHAQGTPGSHVLLKVSAKEPGFKSILEAAAIAAYYSRGKNSTRLPVDYTEVKNLRRPKGARPGFVIYSQQKTIFVKPEIERISNLKIENN
ncbi:MAG: fibronectin-binding domain-containing protein [Deltaproteobacteria bacterium]|nr:fibronectin-binding domain-containing protein [Deltaproteobacteria bacterium]